MPRIHSKICKEEAHPVGEPRMISIDITPEQFEAYTKGEYIQRVLPDQPAEVRERFITGTCPTCWNRIFSDDEDD